MTDKLQGILRIPTAQNVAKNSLDFPMCGQPIRSSKTETTITQGTIQNINREIAFYPDPIYRPPPRPPENFQSPRIESKGDTSPRIDLEFKENSPCQEGMTYQSPDKSYFQNQKN